MSLMHIATEAINVSLLQNAHNAAVQLFSIASSPARVPVEDIDVYKMNLVYTRVLGRT